MKMCLNCKRCEIVCPQGVKVGDIIQSARIKYSLQGIGIREFMLANTDLVGTLATHSFGLANRVVNMGLTKWMLHKMVGIHQGRTFPAYASHTFGARFELLVDKFGGEVDALCHATVVESEQTLILAAHGEGARRRGGDDALGVA